MLSFSHFTVTRHARGHSTTYTVMKSYMWSHYGHTSMHTDLLLHMDTLSRTQFLCAVYEVTRHARGHGIMYTPLSLSSARF